MTTDTYTLGPEIPPGNIDSDRFVTAFEGMKQKETGNEDWELDEDQRAAVLDDNGPLHLTAGPGTGKTTVTVASVLKWLLVDGVPPGGIIVTTFTEKAADNVEQRLEAAIAALGYADLITIDEMYVGTSHQLWSEIMRDFRYDDFQNVEVLDADAQEMFLLRHSDYVDVLAEQDAEYFADVVPHIFDDGETTRTMAANAVTSLFNRLSQFRTDIESLTGAEDPELRRLAGGYRNYRETLREESRCDFTQLQERFISFLETDAGHRFATGDPARDQPPLQRIAVDEYQDANPLQQDIYFRLAEMMPASRPQFVVVGDDDQALYRFRGGTVDCLIEFPERVSDYLDLPEDAVTTRQLRQNYRSRPEIVRWINRHIGDYPAMQEEGARAPGKQPLQPNRGPVEDPAVNLLKEDNKQAAAAAFAARVEQLRDEGYIQDYSQVALLAHSTRERWQQYDNDTFVGECVAALEAQDIPVHNPRNKAFLQHEEVQAMLGALVRCLDPDGRWAEENVEGNLADEIGNWLDTLNDVVMNHDAHALAGYIEDTASNIVATDPGQVADVSLIDLYNRLRSFEPFATWTSHDGDLDRTERLGKLSQLLESFEGIASGLTENRHLIAADADEPDTVSTWFLGDFYWTFCRYLETEDLDDPQDPHETLPLGHVQVMTVHQAKGLEFPVVFVTSLNRTPDNDYDVGDDETPVPKVADLLAPHTDRTPPVDVPTRAERDLVRQFYVAHSRAEGRLVLLGTDYYLRPANGAQVIPSLGADGTTPLTKDWFDSEQRLDQGADLAAESNTVGAPEPDQTRRTYSIVADVLSFRRCKRQYGYHAEHEFAAGSGTQLFAGLAVHQTLDWAHRYYNGDINGIAGGSPPSQEELKDEFDNVVETLRDQRIMPMGQDAVDAIFGHIARFNEHVGPSLYPQVVDTECKLRRNAGDFLLTGVADVIADDDGHTTLADYKATDRPDTGDSYLEDYREQLLVYAGLYRDKDGEYPDSAVLYFLAEEDPEATKLELDFDPSNIAAAMERFEQTIEELEDTRVNNSWSDLDPSDVPDSETCDECDFRWDCPQRDYDDR